MDRDSPLRRKTIAQALASADTDGARLHRALSRWDLIAIGVAAIVGAGIFVVTGVAAAQKAGPAIVLSFVLAGVVCTLAALCYSELAAMLPIAGSTYSYGYVSFGELPAFLLGWDLLLELTVAGAAVAIGWSGTLQAALDTFFGIHLPDAIAAAPADGGVVNLPAMAAIAVVALVLVRGVRITARTAGALLAVIIGVLGLVIVLGGIHVDTANWAPFAPFGFHGVVRGAAVAFFAYLGFDIVATTAEEARDPQRDIPWGIVGSLVVATVLYIAVALVVTGLVPYAKIDLEAPVAAAMTGISGSWVSDVILIGSVIALTKGLLVIFLGQSRLGFAISRDGLLPRGLAAVGARGTPHRLVGITAVVMALGAGLLPIATVAELVNIGALVAFASVSIGVLWLRHAEPERERPFRAPAMPVVPVLAVAGCVYLATTLAGLTWLRFGVWMAVGLAIYALYGRRHSALAPAVDRPPTPAADLAEVAR